MKLKRIIISMVVTLGFISPSYAGEWSNYRIITASNGISLAFKTSDTKCGSSIKWKAINESNERIGVSIRDKAYICRNGEQDSASDESFGKISSGDDSTLMPDNCRCKGKGGIDTAEASISTHDW